jgi:uncharacterized protein YbbC (DUF1343 family)
LERVIVGLEQLASTGPAAAGLPRRSRVALLAHAASIDAAGRHAVERLARHDGFELCRLFAPEHGLWGHEQDMEAVATARDPLTGLEVVSLYGSDPASLKPHPDQLAGLDAVICDVQDVGSRYYTFVYTVAHVMEAARDAGLPVVVADRPNPIGGARSEGPVLRSEFASFVGRYPLPVRHGLTAGELARLFNERFGIGCDLRVVPVQGLTRSMRWRDTGLPWVPPSPNMPTPRTAEVYPGGCLVEGTTLSEGRGTTTPFELVGAPWIDPLALVAELRSRGLSGAIFRAASFRPMFQKHAGLACRGVQVIVTDPAAFRPFATYLELLRAAIGQGRGRFRWRTEPYEFESGRAAIDLLLGRGDLRQRIERGEGASDLEPDWRADLERFEHLREDVRLYPD